MNSSAQRPQFRQQHVLPSNDFSEHNYNAQAFLENRLDPSLGQELSQINAPTGGQRFESDPRGLDPNFGDFSQQRQEHDYDDRFMVDLQLQPNTEFQGHINPADIMSNTSSPQNMVSTPPSLMPPETHSSGPTSPPASQGQQMSPNHSRQASLDPSAAFTTGQQPSDWAGMLSGAQFQNHRRAPSEHSDVSSSVAPSPFLAQQESFDQFDQNPSPMLSAQPEDQMYQGGLGIESFSLSEPQQRNSPRHSPFVSPRMSPQPGLGLAQDHNFITLPNANHNFNGGPGSELYTNQNEAFPSFQPDERLGSNDMGQAAQMAPPEINVEFAPATRQPNFDPPRLESDFDALSPPAGKFPPPLIYYLTYLLCIKSAKGACAPNRIQTSTHGLQLPTPIVPPWVLRTRPLIIDIGLCRLMVRISLLALLALGRLLPHQGHRLVAHPPHPSRIVITSSSLLIPPGLLHLEPRSGSKSIPLPSNVPSAPRNSLEHIIFDPIFVLIPMSVLSYAQSAAKPLLANMIARDTRDCTVERRSSFAVAS